LLPHLKERIKDKGFLPADAAERDPSWLDTYALVQDMVQDFDEYVPSTYLQYYIYPEYKASKLNADYTRANEVMDGRFRMPPSSQSKQSGRDPCSKK